MIFNTASPKLTVAQSNVQNIVVATDFSESSDFAISTAIKIAKKTRANLTILHVIQKELFDFNKILEKVSPEESLQTPIEYAETLMIKKIRSLLRYKLNINYQIFSSKKNPAIKILQYAQKNKVDLLVIGAHGKHSIRDLFVGTTAELIAQQTRCPTLIVKNSLHKHYHKILVAIDYSTASKQALNYVIRVFPDSNKKLIHVGDYAYEDILKREDDFVRTKKDILTKIRKAILLSLQSRMKKFISRYGNKLKKYTCKIILGYPGPTIIKEAEKLKSDLIVMGTEGYRQHYYLFTGVMIKWIISEAGKDILLVPPNISK